MASIPIDAQLEGELSRGLDIPTGGAEAFGNAGAHVARQIRVATEGIAGAANAIEQHNTLEQNTAANDATDKLDQQVLGNGPGSWSEARAKGIHFADYVNDTVSPALDKIGEGSTTQGAQEHWSQLRKAQLFGYTRQFAADEAQDSKDRVEASAHSAYDDAAKNVDIDPARLPDELEKARIKVTGLFNAAGVSPDLQANHIREWGQTVGDAALSGIASRAETMQMKGPQIDATLAMLNDPDNVMVKAASPHGLEAARNRLLVAKNTQGNIASYQASAHVEDWARSIAQNDANASDSLRNLQWLKANPTGETPTARAEFSEKIGVKIDHSLATQSAVRSTTGMNRDQLVQIERTKPVSPSEEQSALVETAITQRKAMDGDPANTLIENNPTVRNASLAFTSNPSPQTWQAYRTASAALQRQYNPGRVPRLVPQGMHDQIAQDMQGITQDANGATQAGATLSKWAGVTGSDWPNVAEELRASHVINNDQYAAAELYGKKGQGGLTTALLQSSTMTNDQRRMLHGIEIGAAKTAAAQAFDGFNKTFANIQNSQGFIEAQTDALAHLIQTKGLNPKDLDVNDPNDPIMQIAHDMVLDEFNIVGDTLRVPSQQNADAIEAGTVRAQGNIDSPGKDPHWYTTPDGSGATLYPEPGASAPVAVKGKPLTLTWKQLATLGQH